MALKQFKAESKRLLDLMINSIYTHKEIFLRELISNASDAIDKLYYLSLTDEKIGVSRDGFVINLKPDPQSRTLIISDNGIGMTKEELELNLGTIAKSGSMAFKNENEAKEDISIIGQFGVGFYSAFMVSKKITVTSRAYGSDTAYRWESSGVDGYTIAECDKSTTGTEIILYIKENTDEENYDEFLTTYRLKELVKKYSDYIRYPIKMDIESSRPKDGPDGKKEYETYTENETLNSMIPIWKRLKSEISDEDYNTFYKDKFFDFEDPLKVIHMNTEGVSTFNALMFIPSKTPYDYYSREYEKGLQLYSSGVLIMEKCPDLLPDHFSFVKGIVDSQDLSLNISRELLQHDRQLKNIAGRLEKKIKAELKEMLQNERDKYETFYKNFGRQLKIGIYTSYGANKELLEDLLMFYSSTEKKMITFSEYAQRMKEEQTHIYYACGQSVDQIALLPQTERIQDKGYEILYCTDDIDEFALRMIGKIGEKELQSVSSNDLNIENEEEKKELEKVESESRSLLDSLKDSLGGKVSAVRLSKRLKSHPVCLTSEGEISLEMEKILNAMPVDEKIKANRVLEINSSHPVYKVLKDHESDKEKIGKYATLLYNQALLIEGLTVDNPVEFSEMICSLMS
ncbi:MAG: molecular chaperone HtpG [Clostridiales bacterium]|nr:molecular chaperone HtpG [Clostridiales bacterium]